MTEKGRKDFCTECRKETEYLLQKKDIGKCIRDKEYTLTITMAVCAKCGEEMSIPGLIDKNIQEIDGQYRAAEGLVSMDDIEKLMKIYKIGKAPLSLALGFGEVTIPRYLDGQIPSKTYSNVIKAALASPAYMKRKLMENRKKLSDAAYKKALSAAESIESLFSISDKMLRVIAYVFENALTDDEKRMIDLVVNTFGMYGGKVLERITHNEDPWMEARKGYGDSIPPSELLSKERIMKFYIAINQKR